MRHAGTWKKPMPSMLGDVMIDSSAWIEYFRYRNGMVLDALLDAGRAVLCGTIEGEVLRGIRLTEGLRTEELRRVGEIFMALPYIDAWEEDYRATGNQVTKLRRRGITIPVSDCLIGVLCMRYGLSLLTLDKHFDYLPEVEHFPAVRLSGR